MDGDCVRKQLERLLASPEFVRAPRHSRFLTFIVEETVEGRGGELKEYVIATTVFEKPASFDPREDSTVRTEASKLRTRLERYYAGPGRSDEVRIVLPRGGYAPVFVSRTVALEPGPEPEVEGKSEPPAVSINKPRTIPTLRLAAILGLLLGGGGTSFFLLRNNSPAPPRIASLTTLNLPPGQKRTISFSPDGRLLAFSWTGPENAGNWDIWVANLDNPGAAPKRLTFDAAQDWSPSWSPDGRTIAFVRDPYEKAQVFVVPAEGGPERMLEGVRAFRLIWMQDGKTLAVLRDVPGRDSATAVFVMNLETRASKQVTFPTREELHGHTNFAVSPDGKRVAYISSTGNGRRVMTAPLDGNGGGQVVASGSRSFSSVDWAPDGSGLFVVEGEPVSRLHYLPLRGRQNKMEAIPGLESRNIGHFGASRGSAPTRIAANITNANFEIWIQTGGEAKSGKLLINAEGNAWAPQFSPDGSAIAFLSDRSGSTQVWTAREDGSGSTQVTSSLPCTPISVRWAPGAGKMLIFDCLGLGTNSGIYTAATEGGKPQRLEAPAHATNPSYSANGQNIYFTSAQSGRSEIWQIPASGSDRAIPVTHNGAVQGLETEDGKSLIFLKDLKDAPLWRLNLADGRETPLAGYAWRGWWELKRTGEVAVVDSAGKILLLGRDRESLGNIGPPAPNRGGFSIHPTKRQIIYGRATGFSEDLVVAQFDR